MSVQIRKNETPVSERELVAKGILSAIGESQDLWQVEITLDSKNNAWDVEVQGPNEFHWARRFSGADRDAEVISEAVRSAILDQAA
jgi:hypothetical protein